MAVWPSAVAATFAGTDTLASARMNRLSLVMSAISVRFPGWHGHVDEAAARAGADGVG